MMDATYEYWTGQFRSDHPARLETFTARSDALANRMPAGLDFAYGSHPRERFDFFASAEPWRATLAYFHAGYWQARDKAQFRFIAEYLLPAGIDVGLVNYPLCPDVSLETLLESTKAAIPALLRHAGGLARGGRAVVAAGHSAGGHIAAELSLSEPAIAAVAAFSGLYALEDLLETPVNDKLSLDQARAKALSPLFRIRSGLPPALFAVGALETQAFRDQNADMAQSWVAAGNSATMLEVADADHFSLLDAPALWRAVRGLAAR